MMNPPTANASNMDFQRYPQNGGMPQRQDYGQAYQQEQMRQQMMPQQMSLANQPQTIPAAILSGMSRVVSSRNEAEAVTADFSGAYMVFYDIAHDCVYIKRWDMVSGSAVFTEYAKTDGRQQNTQFAFSKDVRDLYDMVESIMKDVDKLKSQNNQNRKGNDEK